MADSDNTYNTCCIGDKDMNDRYDAADTIAWYSESYNTDSVFGAEPGVPSGGSAYTISGYYPYYTGHTG